MSKRTLEEPSARRVRQALPEPELPTELVDAVFFRFAGVKGRRAVGATCRRFREWYFHTYVRRFTIGPSLTTDTLCAMMPFHPATSVMVLAPSVRLLTQNWLICVHRLLAQHAFRRIPLFADNVLRAYCTRFRPFLDITLQDEIEIDFASNYLSVVKTARGVRVLKLVVESFVRNAAGIGVFPDFPDLETLHISHPPRVHICANDFEIFHAELVCLLVRFKPKLLLLTPQLWNKYNRTPGKLPLTNVSIKKA